MISEGSCDTEDWSNDAENTALHHRNKLHWKYFQFQIENSFFFFFYFELKKRQEHLKCKVLN